MSLSLTNRRGRHIDIAGEMARRSRDLPASALESFEFLDLIYRSLCAVLYNYVPMSGHPGGSISSGRFVAALLYGAMDYDMSDPRREDADIISYAAGHKALGLYAGWALRNEVVRLCAPALLPENDDNQLRLEDLLGFRRNPITKTPLFKKFRSKALDGHPTPGTPFIRLSTGASGVGLASSLGLAFAARDYFGSSAPRVHIVEGEGGMTPGRVSEALAAAGTSSLGNAILHVDWNQASIDSSRVCRENDQPGDYVQWDPVELVYLHDWNVVYVPEGMDFRQILAAQQAALEMDNGQPTAIVYKTTKGWKYGIEGRSSHGAGHKLCSDGFHQAVAPLLKHAGAVLPKCEANAQRCKGGSTADVMEECYWEALGVVRKALKNNKPLVAVMARRIEESRRRLDLRALKPRAGAPHIEAVFDAAKKNLKSGAPQELAVKSGTVATLRGQLGNVLNYYNKLGGGAIFAVSADLMGSTSIEVSSKGFPEGFFNARTNPGSRALSLGGICEDAQTAILAGISTFGHHLGVGSSYGAFLAPLGHIAARLHAIGEQMNHSVTGAPCRPFVMVCAHAGLKTGEDGPTHADPQPLQLLQENFPKGTMITLTPWEHNEIFPLFTAALASRPAVIAVFVTRPNETAPNRARLAPSSDSVHGVYLLRRAKGKGDGVVVLQESAVTFAFVEETLPLLEKKGIDLNVYHVSSAELFDRLPAARQQKIFSGETAREAMGITGFTLPTMYRWITSDIGRSSTLHPFGKGHFLGSGQGRVVLEEAGLHGHGQYKAVLKYLDLKKRRRA